MRAENMNGVIIPGEHGDRLAEFGLCARETEHDMLNSARHLQPERLVGYMHDSHGRSGICYLVPHRAQARDGHSK